MIKKLTQHFDIPSLMIISTTFVLFIAALFTKEKLRDIFLEFAVFLVSLKLIMAAYKQSVESEKIQKKLDRIEKNTRDR